MGKLGLSRWEESALVTLFVFEILCILLYGAASALGAFGLRRDHRRAARAAKGVYLVAVAAHSAVIGMESVSTEGTLLSGPNIVMLASWVLAVVTAAGLLVTRRGLAFSTVAAPVVALLILVSQWLRILDPAGADNMAFYHWPLLVPHIVLVFVALACFATSAISAAAFCISQGMPTESSARLTSTRKSSQLQPGSSWWLMVSSHLARLAFRASVKDAQTFSGVSRMAQARAAISTNSWS